MEINGVRNSSSGLLMLTPQPPIANSVPLEAIYSAQATMHNEILYLLQHTIQKIDNNHYIFKEPGYTREKFKKYAKVNKKLFEIDALIEKYNSDYPWDNNFSSSIGLNKIKEELSNVLKSFRNNDHYTGVSVGNAFKGIGQQILIPAVIVSSATLLSAGVQAGLNKLRARIDDDDSKVLNLVVLLVLLMLFSWSMCRFSGGMHHYFRGTGPLQRGTSLTMLLTTVLSIGLALGVRFSPLGILGLVALAGSAWYSFPRDMFNAIAPASDYRRTLSAYQAQLVWEVEEKLEIEHGFLPFLPRCEVESLSHDQLMRCQVPLFNHSQAHDLHTRLPRDHIGNFRGWHGWRRPVLAAQGESIISKPLPFSSRETKAWWPNWIKARQRIMLVVLYGGSSMLMLAALPTWLRQAHPGLFTGVCGSIGAVTLITRVPNEMIDDCFGEVVAILDPTDGTLPVSIPPDPNGGIRANIEKFFGEAHTREKALSAGSARVVHNSFTNLVGSMATALDAPKLMYAGAAVNAITRIRGYVSSGTGLAMCHYRWGDTLKPPPPPPKREPQPSMRDQRQTSPTHQEDQNMV